MSDVIPYGRHDIGQEDIDAVVSVLRSEWLTQGPIVPRFEQAIASECEGQYAVAVNSATSALHLACLALGVGRGDFVWTSAITFVASANAAIYCGAEVDFVDIDLTTNNMCISSLEQKLIRAKLNGTLPKVVIPVHFSGSSCDMKEINRLSQLYNFSIIEDASHAIGANYCGVPVGSCVYSDITVFSFHPVKIITSGEGGVAVTNDQKIAEKMRLLRSHGITKDRNLFMSRDQGDWFYEQQDLGFNYRMTDIQAALGLSQLDRLNIFIERRRFLATRYSELMANLPLTLPDPKAINTSSCHLYVIRLHAEPDLSMRSDIYAEMQRNKINVNVHYIPVYWHPFYAKKGFKKGYCSASEEYYRDCLTLPLYPQLTEAQQDYIVNSLSKIIYR